MSFLPPHSAIPELDTELVRERERELEERAERYSELHPDGQEPRVPSKIAARLRRLVGRRPG